MLNAFHQSTQPYHKNNSTVPHICSTHAEVWFQQSCFNFIEIKLLHGCPPVNFLYIWRMTFSKNIYGQLLLIFLTKWRNFQFSSKNNLILHFTKDIPYEMPEHFPVIISTMNYHTVTIYWFPILKKSNTITVFLINNGKHYPRSSNERACEDMLNWKVQENGKWRHFQTASLQWFRCNGFVSNKAY